MTRRRGWLLLAATVTFQAGLSTARPDEYPMVDSKFRAKTAQPMLPGDKPVLVPGTACRDGNCAPQLRECACPPQAHRDHPPFGSYLDRFGKWLFYRSPPTPCECKGHLPPYRPPLIAWFPCKPGQCGAGPWPSCSPAIIVESRPDAPPPLPAAPQITFKDRPLIPGSSAAMSVKQPPVKKPLQPTVKKTELSPSIKFRQAEGSGNAIQPVGASAGDPRGEIAPR